MRRSLHCRGSQRSSRISSKKGERPQCFLHCSAIALAKRPTRPGHGGNGQAAAVQKFCGMIQRGGQVIMRVLDHVRQVTIQPIIERFIVPGSAVMTDEYDIYGRLMEWGYSHQTVCHSHGASKINTGPVTRTAMDTTKFTSTRWRAVGRCYGVGFGLTAAFRRNACLLMLVFSSLFTMLASEATRCSDPSLRPSSPATQFRGSAISIRFWENHWHPRGPRYEHNCLDILRREKNGENCHHCVRVV